MGKFDPNTGLPVTGNTQSSMANPVTSALGNVPTSGLNAGAAPKVDIPGEYLQAGADGTMSVLGDFKPSLAQQQSLDIYNDSLGFDWAGGLNMIGGLASTVMGIDSYFDTKKTNKLQRTALQGNIDTQNEVRGQKRDFLGGTQSAFA